MYYDNREYEYRIPIGIMNECIRKSVPCILNNAELPKSKNHNIDHFIEDFYNVLKDIIVLNNGQTDNVYIKSLSKSN